MEKKKNPFGTIDANENARQEVQDIINATAHAEQPAEEKKPAYSSYDDIYKMLSEQKAANDAQAADADRRARLAKTQEAIGGIYDLGRSIANLYGTTQYAPNINMESMSEKARARYDKAVAERKAYRDAAMNYLLQQNRMNVARDAAEYERWKDAEDMKRADRKQDEIERKNRERELLDAAKLDEQKSWHALQDAYNNRRLSIADYNAISNRMRASSMVEYRRNGGNMTPYIVTTSYEYDPLTGKVTEVKKERTVGGGEVVISRVAVTNGEEVQQPSSPAASGASDGKQLGIGVQSTKSAGKSLGIKVK